MKKIVAMILSVAIVFSIVGCNRKKGADPTGTTDVQGPSDTYEKVDLKDCDGFWYDEQGILFDIDTENMTLTTFEGYVFDILDVTDEGISVRKQTSDEAYYNSSCCLPCFTTMTFPIFQTSKGELIYFDNVCYHEGTDKASNISAEIESKLRNTDFNAYSTGGEKVEIDFPADGKGKIQTSNGEVRWDYENGQLSIEGHNGMPMRVFEDGTMAFYERGRLSKLFNSSAGYDYLGSEKGSYIYYNAQEDEYYLFEIDEKGNAAMFSTDGEELEKYKVAYDNEYDFFLLGDTGLKYRRQTGGDMWMFSGYEVIGTMYDRSTFNGMIEEYRFRILDGECKTLFTNTYDMTFGNQDILITADLSTSEWLPDCLVLEEVTPKEYVTNAVAPSNETMVTDLVKITCYSSFNGATLDLDVKGDDTDPGSLAVRALAENFSSADLRNGDWKIVDTDEGYHVTTNVIYKSSYYYVINIEDLLLANSISDITAMNVLDLDVYNSVWARKIGSDDVLGLVDLQYLSESIYDYDHNCAEFWVYTPEQLATATFYVNVIDSLDIYVQVDSCINIHLMADLDLKDYYWCSLGHIDNTRKSGPNTIVDSYHGIFFGNGHEIKNMKIDESCGRSFTSWADGFTVIGLTLTDADFGILLDTGITSAYGSEAFGTSPKHGAFIDCKLILNNENVYSFCGNLSKTVSFVDCYWEYKGKPQKITESSDDWCSENWVGNYFKRSGEYVYDEQAEYDAYLADPESFHNLSHYTGKEGTYCEGNYAGYSADGIFYTNFGAVMQEN
ncbi:MAG: hypothetical protein J6U54_04915 [Clostridiales bacterium]|nr:hypothetical protein [Clostridiales bacterium]